LPDDSLIGSILRGKDVLVPHGQTTLAAGDRVVLITVPQTHGRAIKTLTGEA
jgi:trk system potassium uptake protein TrkA